MNTRKETYCVAGHCFCLELPEESPVWESLGNYRPFHCEGTDCEPIFTLTYEKNITIGANFKKVKLPPPEDNLDTRFDLYCAQDSGKGIISDLILEIYSNRESTLYGRVLMTGLDSAYEGKKVNVHAALDTVSKFTVNYAAMILYALSTVDSLTLEMHSSVVIHKGKAYMFLGVSGTGKSTHSQLWLNNIEGSRLLNDDNPVMRIGDDGIVRVFGSPWSGKTPCYINDSAPVGAIVLLHQAPENRIVRQRIPLAYGSILSSCTGLKFNTRNADALHRCISSIVCSIPCYDLYCLPDADAAFLCSKEVESQEN